MRFKLQHIVYILLLLSLITPVLGDEFNITTEPRIYFSEDEAVPVEIWYILIGLGILFLGGAWLVLDSRDVLASISTAFLFAAAMATPKVGSFSYVTVPIANCTTPTNCSSFVVAPVVSLVTQSWEAYLLFGLALIAFLMIWDGVIRRFQGTAKESDWPDEKEEKW